MIPALVGLILGPLSSFKRSDNESQRHASVLAIRDAKQHKIPPIPIKETQIFDGPDQWWSSFWLKIGNPGDGTAQTIRVLPSTSFSWIVAINSIGCGPNSPDDCENSRGRFYDPKASAAPLGGVEMAPNSTLQEPIINATLYSDHVSLLSNLGNPIQAESQAIINFAQIEYWVGLLPLNPTPNYIWDASRGQPSLLKSLKEQKQIPSLSWGYTAGSHYRTKRVYGSLTLGGYDSSRFNTTTKTSQLEGDLTDDPTQDFGVSVLSITTQTPDGTNEVDLLTVERVPVIVDSTLPYFYFEQDLCNSFSKALNLTWNSTAGLYLLTEEQKDRLSSSISNITFTLQESTTSGSGVNVPFVFPISAFLLNISLAEINPNLTGWSWYFPLKPAASGASFTLGRAFLQEAYLIADYERKKFTINPVFWPDDMVYQANYRSIDPDGGDGHGDPGGFSRGALAGATVGGIIGGLILACILFLWYRRCQRNRRRLSSKSAPPSYMGGRASEASIAGGRSRASSRIASIFPFRNPWSNNERGYEAAHDPGYVMPPQGDQKDHLGNELDANTTGIYEMYQPKRETLEVQGDTAYPSNGGLAPGAGGNIRASSSSIDPLTTVDVAGKPANVFEMEANSLGRHSAGPSPSSAEVAERHVLQSTEQQGQQRPEPGDRRTSGHSTVSAPSPHPTNECHMSDRSFVSLSVFSDAGTGTLSSIFADHPFSTPAGIAGSEALPQRDNESQERGGDVTTGIDGESAARATVAPEAEAGGKQPSQTQTKQPQTRRPSASVISRSTSSRSRSGSEEPPPNLDAISEDHEREGGAWTKAQ